MIQIKQNDSSILIVMEKNHETYNTMDDLIVIALPAILGASRLTSRLDGFV